MLGETISEMFAFMQQNKELRTLHCSIFLHLQLCELIIQQGVYDLTVEQLWNLLYPGDTTPEWSPQCALNEVNICLLYSATAISFTVLE